MGQREGEKLLAAWSPREFASAVATLAQASGRSRSALIREAVAKHALEATAARTDRVDGRGTRAA